MGQRQGHSRNDSVQQQTISSTNKTSILLRLAWSLLYGRVGTGVWAVLGIITLGALFFEIPLAWGWAESFWAPQTFGLLAFVLLLLWTARRRVWAFLATNSHSPNGRSRIAHSSCQGLTGVEKERMASCLVAKWALTTILVLWGWLMEGMMSLNALDMRARIIMWLTFFAFLVVSPLKGRYRWGGSLIILAFLRGCMMQ